MNEPQTDNRPEMQPDPDSAPRPAAWWPVLVVLAGFLVVAVPLIVTQHERGRGRFDQVNYHEPAILRFAEQLPTPDVSDYLSATTPGYHLVLAVVARTVSESLVVLQLVGMLFTVGMLAVLTRWLTPRAGPVLAVLLPLCFVSSLYVFNAGVHLLPDNAAWLGVLGVLLIALRPRFDAVTVVGGGAVLLGLVLIRQNHLWAAGPLLAAAWLGPVFQGETSPIREVGGLLGDLPSRLRRTALMVLGVLPAFVAVGLFARLWGGLTVPIYQDYMSGPNPATPAFVLAQLGVIAAFHGLFLLGPAWRLVRTKPVTLGLVIAAGLLVVLLPETTYDREAGRYSGLWNIVNKLPDLLGRTNSLLLVLAPAGAVALAVWVSAIGARSRWVVLGAFAGFTAAVTMTHNAWARYHEPFLLIMAALSSAMVVHTASQAPGRWARAGRLAGVVALWAALAAVTVQKTLTEKPETEPKAQQEATNPPLELWPLWPETWDRVGDRPTELLEGEASPGGEESP